jgi:pimeloyl-ACP methyl ester carboxylesterase
VPSASRALAIGLVVGALGVSVSPADAEPLRPAVVLVHGAWADASSWDGEVEALTRQGYDVRAIANPLENLITEAAAGNPEVKALVYVDAAAPDVGETNGSLSGADSVLKQKPEAELFDKLPIPGAPAGTFDLYLKRDIFLRHFGNDLPAETANRLWATQRTASTAAFETPASQAGWKTIPSWYFISSGDQIITPTSEYAMATRARSQVTTFDGGSHLTLISHPEAVTAVIESAIASVR